MTIQFSKTGGGGTMSNQNNTIATTLFVAFGAFASGLALGLLVAPKSGRESREFIEEQVRVYGARVAEKAKEVAQETLKSAQESMNRHVGVLENEKDWEKVGKEVADDVDKMMKN